VNRHDLAHLFGDFQILSSQHHKRASYRAIAADFAVAGEAEI